MAGDAGVQVGDVFAGYRIEGELARGGMGVVFRARDVELDRLVALKLIRPDLSTDDAYRQRFRAESRTAARIEHPHVVSIYEARERDGVLYLVMQFIQGHDLRTEIIQKGRLGAGLAVSLVEGAASGLDAVHAAGLVHRDVKPANVLISHRDGKPHALVTDFGVARTAAATTSMTETGQFVGTLDYVAPEQLQGLPVDARTDVYALGCLLYETVTGQVPFPGTEGPAKMFGHVHGDVPRIDPGIGESAAALNPILERALAKRPDDRFPSAGDLGRAARAALGGREPIAAERVVGVGDAAPSVIRRPEAGDMTLPGNRTPPPPPPTSEQRVAPPPPPPEPTEPQPGRGGGRGGAGRPPGRDEDEGSGGRAKGVLAGAAIALIAGGLVFAAIQLSSGGDGGGGERTVAQQRGGTTTVTTTSGGQESTVTTTTTAPSTGGGWRLGDSRGAQGQQGGLRRRRPEHLRGGQHARRGGGHPGGNRERRAPEGLLLRRRRVHRHRHRRPQRADRHRFLRRHADRGLLRDLRPLRSRLLPLRRDCDRQLLVDRQRASAAGPDPADRLRLRQPPLSGCAHRDRQQQHRQEPGDVEVEPVLEGDLDRDDHRRPERRDLGR